MNQQEQLEAIIGANMGCYYREATKQWLRQINDLHTKKYDHLEDMTAEVLGTTQAITALIQEAVKEGRVSELKQIEPPEQYEEFAKLAGHDACRICGFNAVKFRHHILDRIKSLSGGSNNG